jgi:PPOX class probable F420-dependent enzyme
MNIPDSYLDIIDRKAFAHLATVMPDGGPQNSPVWIDRDGQTLIVNSAEGRRKDKNIKADPRVALSISDPENPYRTLMIRGTVTEITTDGADDHINSMAKKYMGVDEYPFRQPGEVRVIYKVTAARVSSMG